MSAIEEAGQREMPKAKKITKEDIIKDLMKKPKEELVGLFGRSKSAIVFKNSEYGKYLFDGFRQFCEIVGENKKNLPMEMLYAPNGSRQMMEMLKDDVRADCYTQIIHGLDLDITMGLYAEEADKRIEKEKVEGKNK